jgi:hypothetical protein
VPLQKKISGVATENLLQQPHDLPRLCGSYLSVFCVLLELEFSVELRQQSGELADLDNERRIGFDDCRFKQVD